MNGFSQAYCAAVKLISSKLRSSSKPRKISSKWYLPHETLLYVSFTSKRSFSIRVGLEGQPDWFAWPILREPILAKAGDVIRRSIHEGCQVFREQFRYQLQIEGQLERKLLQQILLSWWVLRVRESTGGQHCQRRPRPWRWRWARWLTCNPKIDLDCQVHDVNGDCHVSARWLMIVSYFTSSKQANSFN